MTAQTTPTAVTCTLCGGEVTAKDPVRYPYCRTCHYTGAAAEHIRGEQIAYFEKAFPGSRVAIEHTGGGCFWLAIRWPDSEKYIVLTDGEAALPTDPDTDDAIRGGWGYVGRHDDTDEESNADYEGSPLYFGEAAFGDPSQGLTDEQAVELIREKFPRASAEPRRVILVHMNVELPASDTRSADEVAAYLLDALAVGDEGRSAPATVALAEEV